jgi:hypothetical protein
MVLQAQAVRPVVLATTDPSATTATPVDRALRVTTVRHGTTAEHALCVMTAPLAQIAPTVPPETNTLSVMVAPFVKAATLTPRASSTVRFEPHGMSDVTSVPRAMTVRFAMIVRHVTTALPVDRAQRATTVHRARIEPIVRSVPLVTIVLHVMTAIRVMTVVPLVMTDRHETTVPPAAIPTSTPRETRRRSTSPVRMSYSSVFRQWPLPPMTSMV